MGAKDDRGVANLDLRRMVGRNDIGDTYYIYKLLASFQRGFVKFSHYKSMRTHDPWVEAILDPRSCIGRIYVGDH